MARNRVFARSFVTARRFGKKPGFLDGARGARNRVFAKILPYGAKIWEKTRFLKIVGGWSETGFLRDTSLQPADLGKNPVSLMREGPETGFL
ncbi:MAG: hypothetical protein WBL95_04335 [Microcoleus sp.]